MHIPAGQLVGPGLTASQAQLLAELAHRYGAGEVEFVVRQQVQVRGIPPESLAEFLAALERGGMTSLRPDGPCVRNLTSCPLAGLDAGEVLDPSPVVREVLARVSRLDRLPHKLNVAGTGCRHNCVGAEIQDLAFVPAPAGNWAGFTAWAGGVLAVARGWLGPSGYGYCPRRCLPSSRRCWPSSPPPRRAPARGRITLVSGPSGRSGCRPTGWPCRAAA